MGAVSLETGRLRYITETGAAIERDGSPVTTPLTSVDPPTVAILAAGQSVSETAVPTGWPGELNGPPPHDPSTCHL
jgi:hypothetical protein